MKRDGPVACLLSHGAWVAMDPRFRLPPCLRLTQSAEKPTPKPGRNCRNCWGSIRKLRLADLIGCFHHRLGLSELLRSMDIASLGMGPFRACAGTTSQGLLRFVDNPRHCYGHVEGGCIVMWPRSAPRPQFNVKGVALMAIAHTSFIFDAPQTSREELAERTNDLLLEAETADAARRQQIIDEVVCSHLWLAETLARRFLHRGEDEEDLLQVACTGLVEACQRFDPRQGSFVGFAVPTITGVLKRHFRDHGWVVRPPRPTQELASTIWRQWPTLVQQMGSVPRSRDLADELGAPVGAVRQARFASQGYSASSIDAAMLRGICFCSNETEEDIGRTEARMIIEEALAKLDEVERRLIWLRFYEQRSQAEIAEEIGTSQMQVSRLLSRLMIKLRMIIGVPDTLAAAS
jgi:RNA polymerase sigma-B factor